MSRLPITRSINVAKNLRAAAFQDEDINLFDLHVALHGAGIGLVQGRSFTGCRIQGPAVMLVSAGVHFDDCNFGDPDGDMRNLVLFPAGPRALGTVPMRDCRFSGCEFHNVAFTGPEATLKQLLAIGRQ